MSTIKLEFTKSLSRLAGNDFGQKIYKEQVEDKLDYSKKNIIEFPETIDYVAISFIQGFIKGIINNDSSIDKNNILDVIEFKAKNDRVLTKILKGLRY